MVNIVILAAGMGKRMYADIPKVLHKVAGQPLLAHVLSTARQLHPIKLFVVYGHGGELVKQVFDAPDICFVHQSVQLGTGHAVQQATPFLDDVYPTLVLAGDVPCIQKASLEALIEVAGNDKLGLLTQTLTDPTGYGRIIRKAGNISAIVEQKDANVEEVRIQEINTGILIAPTMYLKRWLARLTNDNAQGEYYLTDIVAQAVNDGVPCVSAQPSFEWETLGVNSKQQLAEIERRYQQHIAQTLLGQGVTLLDPHRVDVRGQLICGKNVVIDVGCIFEGRVVLADDVHIGAYCVIKDSDINTGTVVKPFCHIENAHIGADAEVGPYARLRPGTQLAEKVHIGNFVEVKNTQVGVASKANHLSYLGDATIGERVNIGAGTITCNYDGVNKSRTIIEDDVFIGSDTQLIAPVTVGKGATIGAGTTLTKDAPPNQLTVARTKQLSIAHWVRPTKKLVK